MSAYYTLLTKIGLAKLTNAQSSGSVVQWSHMAVGDGNGAAVTPTETQTALVHETYRASINRLAVDDSNPNYLIVELVIPATIGGFTIREIGIFDTEGNLVVVANSPENYKPVLSEGSATDLVVRVIVMLSNTSAVQLKIDPSVVLATRKYVDDSITAALNKQDGKQSVRLATTAAIALTGLQVIDGVQLASGDRVLVKDQAASKENGIYIAASGAWSRASDADASIEVTPGMFVTVEQGAINADSVWQLITDGSITLGTTALTFELSAGRLGGRLLGVQTFSTPGTFTYTPTYGTKSIIVEAVGGGGAGGGTAATNASSFAIAGGGGAGSYAMGKFTSGFSGVTVTVGDGGAGVSASAGGNGGTSSFGALLSCPGGNGAPVGPSVASGSSGLAVGGPSSSSPSGGNLSSAPGSGGGIGITTQTGGTASGMGANSFFGGSGRGNGGVAAGGYGSGGSGSSQIASGVALTGGAGKNGIVIIREFS